MVTLLISTTSQTWTDPEEEGGPDPLGKSQVAIGSLTKSVTDLPREAIGPEGPIAFQGMAAK